MNQKDRNLVEFLITNTQNGNLRWEPTAVKNTLLVALRGRYTAEIVFQEEAADVLRLKNSEGQTILWLSGDEDSRIDRLFELATRNAYRVDEAIDEILSSEPEEAEEPPIADEDIPF